MVSDWGEVVTRYPYGNVRMDHLLSKETTLLFFLFRMRSELSWLEHTPDKREVGGSSPLERTIMGI